MKSSTSPLLLTLCLLATSAAAELRLPALFTDHLVLQQKLPAPVWGWDNPGTQVTVTFAGQSKQATAAADGRWEVTLDPMEASSESREMSIQGTNAILLSDVLVGEVWVCSGQSNMGFNLASNWDADLEIATAKHPNIRLISVPNVGSQEPLSDFEGRWERCSPQTVGAFSAVGYVFGELIHKMLDVPIGLIDNAWGGSAAEAWVRKDLLENDPRYAALLADWAIKEKTFDFEAVKASHIKAMEQWKARAEAAKAAGNIPPQAPRPPQNILAGQQRPANLYNGCLHPIIGYGIRGAIWYQGESNAGRAAEYRHLFPMMIQHWRDEWQQGDFPFYWVQLADYYEEADAPGDSPWAELREAQTLTLNALPNTGQAVIIDLGEASDIHPKNKRDVAERLARWALAKDYGINLPHRSPEFQTVDFSANKIILTFDHVGKGLRTVDSAKLQGFTVCGDDRVWKPAQAHFVYGNPVHQVELTCPEVKSPVAVRYAWANNPVCNLYSQDGLPLTPFRTDSFESKKAAK